MKNEEFMKAIHLIIYSILLLGTTACENEIPYTIGSGEPQLIMNALLDAGEPENYVFLNLSGTEGISHVEQASVTLYVNGQLAGNGGRTATLEAHRQFRYGVRPQCPAQ